MEAAATASKQPASDMEAASTCDGSSSGSRGNSDKCPTATKAASKVGGTFRSGGTIPTAVCLSKAAIGAGVLSMSVHSAEVGMLYQLCSLAAGALLTLISIRMIARASIETNCWSYEDICEELFHPAMSFVTGFINVCNCLGSGAGYLIVCGQVFQVATGATESTRKLFVLLVGVFVCAPMALARHVGFMRHLAALSVGALLLLVGTVVWVLGKEGQDDTVTADTMWLGPGGVTVFTYMNSINNIVFSYNNQFNVPQLAGELTPQPSVQKMTAVSLITVTACFALFSAVSVFGVLAFGVGEGQKDSLVLDLAPQSHHPLVFVALLAVMLSVLTCFQFHVFPIRQFAAWAARKARGRGPDEEESDAKCCGRSVTRWLDIASALTSVAVIILIAVVISSLKTILDLIGAFAAAYISYIVPPLWVLQLLRRERGFTWASAEVLGCLTLLCLGCFFFVFGTYSAILEALSH